MKEEVTVLLVEDDELEAETVKRAFKKAKIANPIVWARDGREALDIMLGRNGREPTKRPFLVLLDINMPRMNGIEFLNHVRADKTLKDSIIFVLTTSNFEKDRFDAYQRNIAGYLLKSDLGKDFVKLVTMLDGYWSVVKFPEEVK